MRTRISAGTIVAAVLVSAGLALSAAAQGVGAIGGNVSDGSGAALPGVTVSLSNPGVIGGDQSTVTDERGAYQFTRLVPGNNYAVKTALQGFRTGHSRAPWKSRRAGRSSTRRRTSRDATSRRARRT